MSLLHKVSIQTEGAEVMLVGKNQRQVLSSSDRTNEIDKEFIIRLLVNVLSRF